VLALLSFGLVQLIIGYSLLEGVGSALMIPPIYILVGPPNRVPARWCRSDQSSLAPDAVPRGRQLTRI
jgi:hypothetical protein